VDAFKKFAGLFSFILIFSFLVSFFLQDKNCDLMDSTFTVFINISMVTIFVTGVIIICADVFDKFLPSYSGGALYFFSMLGAVVIGGKTILPPLSKFFLSIFSIHC